LDDDSYLNQIKLQCLKKGQLWFSYYKFLNDKTEFDMKYDAKRVSYKTGIPCDNIRFFVATMKEQTC
jgi:ssDNA-specific exonuclease RecJ